MKDIFIDLIESDKRHGILKQRNGKHFESDCTECYLFRPGENGKCALKNIEVGEGYTCSEWKHYSIRKSLAELNVEAGFQPWYLS